MSGKRIRKYKHDLFFGTLLFVLCLPSLIVPALAASPKEDLEQTQKDMEEVQQHQTDLVEKTSSLEEELKGLQARLVKSAEAVQKTEADLMEAEDKLRILTEQMNAKNEQLKTQQKHLTALVQTALSLSHTPPEAMLMMPGDPGHIMMAARALSMTSSSIKQETVSLGMQMAELNALKEKVTADRDGLAQLQATLDKEHTEILDKLADRKQVQEQLGQEQKEDSKKLGKLAKKAGDLQDLITGIQREEEQEATEHTVEKQRNRSLHLRSFADAKGHIHAPATGKIIQKFGIAQGRNATSKGIVVVTRRNAQVTAPYDGEVVFTGPFLNYGQMIIIRHSDDFHTLLAGLAKIDVGVGQFLLEGEPIGAMGDSDSNGHSENKPAENKPDTKNENRLYIELRKNNQPIDPTSWINGLTAKN